MSCTCLSPSVCCIIEVLNAMHTGRTAWGLGSILYAAVKTSSATIAYFQSTRVTCKTVGEWGGLIDVRMATILHVLAIYRGRTNTCIADVYGMYRKNILNPC